MNTLSSRSITRATLFTVSVTALFLSHLPSSARGYDYYPLEIGTAWYYENGLGERELMTIVREEDLLGNMTRVRLMEGPQVIENYWSTDDDGHVYLHGGRNLTYPMELAYLPPIRMVDAPLYLGKEWITEGIGIYDFEGNYLGSEFDYPLEVYFEGELEVPAGIFYAYGIGFDLTPPLFEGPSGGLYDLLLNRVAAQQPEQWDNPTDWYSDGVGPVQYTRTTPPETWFKLQWWDPPTSPQESTWGEIKTLFR